MVPAEVYRVTKRFPAVTFDRKGNGLICHLRPGMEVEVAGMSPMPGFIEVIYKAVRYSVFREDFLRNANVLPDQDKKECKERYKKGMTLCKEAHSIARETVDEVFPKKAEKPK